MRSFVKIKFSRNGEITLSTTDIGKSNHSREIFRSQVCLLTLFAKVKLSQKFPDLQYFGNSLQLSFQSVLYRTCICQNIHNQDRFHTQLRNNHKPSVLSMGHRQNVQTQIRRHRMRRLTRVSTVF